MKAYIETLQNEVKDKRQQQERDRTKHAKADSRVVCDTPLADQIEALMLSLPPTQRDRPWSMDEFVARLHGRFKARPHPMNVGQALRGLGWVQTRDWTRGGGGRRYWFPQL